MLQVELIDNPVGEGLALQQFQLRLHEFARLNLSPKRRHVFNAGIPPDKSRSPNKQTGGAAPAPPPVKPAGIFDLLQASG